MLMCIQSHAQQPGCAVREMLDSFSRTDPALQFAGRILHLEASFRGGRVQVAVLQNSWI